MRSLLEMADGIMENSFQETQDLYMEVWDILMEISAFDMLKDAQFAKLASALANDSEFFQEAQRYREPDGSYNLDPDFVRVKAWNKVKSSSGR